MIALLLIIATPDAAHPRWLIGDWCFPQGHPLRLRHGDAFDGDEVMTYRADGRWANDMERGRWRVAGNRLIETRTAAEPGALPAGEPLRRTDVTRFVRHGRDALALSSVRRGWQVRCPWSPPPTSGRR